MGALCSAGHMTTSQDSQETTNDHDVDPATPKVDVKILFLDIDGVLNSVATQMCGIDDCHLDHLQTILTSTQCKIVLSSSWKSNDNLKQRFYDALKQIGFDHNIIVLGTTQESKYGVERGIEIQSYLESKQTQTKYNVRQWVAIDDMKLDTPKCQQFIQNHFVHIDRRNGLRQDTAATAIAILNGQTVQLNQQTQEKKDQQAMVDGLLQKYHA